MVAISILLIMGLMIAESLNNSIEFQRLLEDRDVTIRQARVTMSKIRREIEMAYLTPSQHAVETVQTVFVGMNDDPDQLFFATMAHQRVYRDSRECDQAEITLWTERATEEQGRGHVLFHRESPRVDERPDEDGIVYPLAYNVRSFNLRYLDPMDNEWTDEWDTRNTETIYRLPRAAEVGLVLIAPDPMDEDRSIDVPFMTTINLTYGGKLMSKGNPLNNRVSQSLFGGNGNPLMASPLAAFGANGFGGFGTAALSPLAARQANKKAGGGAGRGTAAGSAVRGTDGKVRANPREALMGGKGKR
jgi:general secretion pathway protein J